MAKLYKLLLPLLIFGCLHLPLNSASNSQPTRRRVGISRDHVSVWFEPSFQNESQFLPNNLEKMVNLVGSMFGTILINSPTQTPKKSPVLPDGAPELLIPNIVAKYNLENEKTMKITISFNIPTKSTSEERIQATNLAKRTADRANFIHLGTVDTLLLLDNKILPQNTYSKTEKSDYYSRSMFLYETNLKVRMLSQKFLGNNYKLGVLIPCLDFGVHETSWHSYYLSGISQHVDLIVTLIYFDEFYTDPLEEHILLQKLLDGVEKLKGRNIRKGVEIIPLISCRPPINRDYVEVSKFLECWQLMNNWAQDNNRSVIMYEAFDQYGKDKLHDAGWWRLKSEGNVTTQKFQDESFFIAKVDESFGLSLKPGEKFNSQTSIYFNHRVRFLSRYQKYTEQEVGAMLETVSTRFSSIVIGNNPRDPVVKQILLMVAKMCEQNRNNSSFKPLTIILNILYAFDGGPDLELSRTVAEVANKKFAGTVRTLAFHKFGKGTVEQGHWNKFKKALQESNKTSPGISLATHVDLGDCSFFLQNEFPSVSNWMKVIIVDITGSETPSFRHQYVDSTLRVLFAEWSKCRSSFQMENPQVNVVLSVACSQIPTDSSNIEYEANCWEMVNNWGKENHAQVIFHQAFETPEVAIQSVFEGQTSQQFGGWWKLKRKSELDITVDSFEERFQDLLQIQNERSSDEDQTSHNNCESGHNVGLVVFFTLLIAACTCSIIFTVVWFHRKTSMQQKQTAAWSSEMQLL